jgi:hypothetical protein
MTTFFDYSPCRPFLFLFQKVPIWLATKVCDYRAQVRIFLIIFVGVSCLPFSKAGRWQKLCVLQARHSGDGWKSLVATIQIVKQISSYYQVFENA